MPRVKLFDKNKTLQKAMELFWKKGYHATSIQDLVRHLGINRASLYDTYGGKKNLFDQAIEMYTSNNLDFLNVFFRSKKKVLDLFQDFFTLIISIDLNDEDCKGCFVVNTTTELLPYDIALQNTISSYKQNIIAIFYTALEQGVDAGEIAHDKDIKSLANLLYTVMTGLRVDGKINTNSAAREGTLVLVMALFD